MNSIKGVLKKGINRYGLDAFSAMALGLFSSLIIGLILSQLSRIPGLGFIADFTDVLSAQSPVVGAAIGVAIAHGLKAQPLVVYTSAATGAFGYSFMNAGPMGAYIAAVVGAELGRLVAGKTRVDIVLVPSVTILAGGLAGKFIGPYISGFMTWLGNVINITTELHPIPMGILVSTSMGMILTRPYQQCRFGHFHADVRPCCRCGHSGLFCPNDRFCSSQLPGEQSRGSDSPGLGYLYATGAQHN